MSAIDLAFYITIMKGDLDDKSLGRGMEKGGHELGDIISPIGLRE